MKIFFLLLIGLIMNLNANGAELDLLANHIYRGWENDKSELGYVSTRCAALYGNVQAYLVANGTKSSDKQSAVTLGKSSEQLLTIGMLAASQTGLSADNFKLRYQQISKNYLDRIIANKRLNNNIFDQGITEELQLCKLVAEQVNLALQNK